MDVTRAVTTAVQLGATVSTVPLKATAHIVRGAVNVSEVKPRLGVQFVDAKTDVAYVVPAADLSYILMDVAAYVDVRGLSPIVRDLIPVIDLNSFLVGKGVADQTSQQDSASFEMGRLLSNTVYTGEIIDILLEILRYPEDYYNVSDDSTIGINPNKVEIVVTSEVYSLLYEKGLQEIVAIAEQKNISFSKQASDSQAIADANSIVIGKTLQDAVDNVDEFSRVVDFIRSASDAVGSSEQKSIGVGKNEQDAVTQSDAKLFDFSKAIEDAFSAPDVAAVEASYNRFFDDASAPEDAPQKLYSKNQADEVSTTDDITRVIDFVLELSDSISAIDNFEAVIPVIRFFADQVLTATSSGALNSPYLNQIALGNGIGGDSVRIEFEMPRSLTDSTSMSDSGAYFIQNYVDGSYFLQDYIGTTGSL
jgi:hypothetical protein